MAARIAWVLNLDADLELGARASYAPTKKVRAAMKPHVTQLAASLLGQGDVLIDEDAPSPDTRGLIGRAFSPTPRALGILRRAGAVPEAHPSLDVLRRVNSRAFAAALDPTLPGAAFVTELGVAQAMLDAAPVVGDAWRVKHPFGMAGRNQRVLSPASRDDADLAFVRLALAHGGAQIEPNVAIVEEYAIHGVLTAEGSLRAGALVRQRCDARGAWIATERIPAEAVLAVDVRDRMSAEIASVARALHGAGYFGPFGIDAYAYRDGEGAVRLQPRSEINARYSMGFSVGFGS
jgi:hypothetical protein